MLETVEHDLFGPWARGRACSLREGCRRVSIRPRGRVLLGAGNCKPAVPDNSNGHRTSIHGLSIKAGLRPGSTRLVTLRYPSTRLDTLRPGSIPLDPVATRLDTPRPGCDPAARP